MSLSAIETVSCAISVSCESMCESEISNIKMGEVKTTQPEDSVEKEDDDESSQPPLSKRQKKRLAKKELWIKTKPVRRAKEREKLKKRKIEALSKGISLGPSRKALKNSTMKGSSCKVKVAIDLSFDNLMSERNILKMLKQVQNCYAMNRRSPQPLQFYLTSYNDKSKEQLEKIQKCMNWDVYFRPESYLDVFNKEEIVYLSSESPNVMDNLEDKAYIIGGLVDHNQHKGLCYNLAVEKGVNHARLPIDEFIDMKTRKVLAINHVFQILLKVTQGSSWEEAFLSALPSRKGAIPKGSLENKEMESIET